MAAGSPGHWPGGEGPGLAAGREAEVAFLLVAVRMCRCLWMLAVVASFATVAVVQAWMMAVDRASGSSQLRKLLVLLRRQGPLGMVVQAGDSDAQSARAMEKHRPFLYSMSLKQRHSALAPMIGHSSLCVWEDVLRVNNSQLLQFANHALVSGVDAPAAIPSRPGRMEGGEISMLKGEPKKHTVKPCFAN